MVWISNESKSKHLSLMIEKEETMTKSWFGIKKCSFMDGVILVEELDAEEEEDGDVAAYNEE
ncbi:hypothetical protein M5K25_006348 [Dendrobium thyrsiflorum]|uniref:Uncharacterized protein n=1 Tax=Dendrobium thyrsiflorum TaxID=117978 RepID=A0ABD0VAY9_DENTH